MTDVSEKSYVQPIYVSYSERKNVLSYVEVLLSPVRAVRSWESGPGVAREGSGVGSAYDETGTLNRTPEMLM